MIAPGCIVDLFVAHIEPPKRKFYVVLCTDEPILGFLINSEINAYKQRRPALRDAQLKITKDAHPFLTYDSWIDCSEAHTFPLTYVEREIRTNPPSLLGTLAEPLKSDLLKLVAQSYTLSTVMKERIQRSFVTDEKRAAQD